MMFVYEAPTLTYLGRFDKFGSWYPAAMPEPKPTPARMVLFYSTVEAKPWPAVVVEVFEPKPGAELRCDLFLFPTRGHGPQALMQAVPFSEKPGVRGTCCYPPRLEAPPAPPPPLPVEVPRRDTQLAPNVIVGDPPQPPKP